MDDGMGWIAERKARVFVSIGKFESLPLEGGQGGEGVDDGLDVLVHAWMTLLLY